VKRVALCPFISAFFIVLAFVGCGSSEQADRDWLGTQPQDTTTQERTSFEIRTDTVTTQGPRQPAQPPSQFNSAPVRFMVQIGSFTNVQNASEVQLLARQRYALPVVNDYNAARRRYQIRIGFFETQEDAGEFLQKLRTDFPQEYNDAWVVQIAK
jgi:cell division septation protein DedD